jgi:hypothetical protein
VLVPVVELDCVDRMEATTEAEEVEVVAGEEPNNTAVDVVLKTELPASE